MLELISAPPTQNVLTPLVHMSANVILVLLVMVTLVKTSTNALVQITAPPTQNAAIPLDHMNAIVLMDSKVMEKHAVISMNVKQATLNATFTQSALTQRDHMTAIVLLGMKVTV